MTRGDVWLAEVANKRRPVVVLTRSEVLDVRSLVTVAEVTTSARGLAAEVPLDAAASGLQHDSVVNCDGLHTVAQSRLVSLVGVVGDDTMNDVCAAVAYAIGC